MFSLSGLCFTFSCLIQLIVESPKTLNFDPVYRTLQGHLRGASPREARSSLVSAILRSALDSDLDPPLSFPWSLSSLWCRLLRWWRFSRSRSLSRLLCSCLCFLLFLRLKNEVYIQCAFKSYVFFKGER